MELFNIHGEKVLSLVDSHQEAGYYAVKWNGRDYAGRQVSDGLYLCRFHAGKTMVGLYKTFIEKLYSSITAAILVHLGESKSAFAKRDPLTDGIMSQSSEELQMWTLHPMFIVVFTLLYSCFFFIPNIS